MTIYVNLLLLLSVVLGQRMKNIDYLGFGYDIYKGNPLNTKARIDPGFNIQKIFNFTYLEHKKTSDGRFDIPDDTDVARQEVCSLEFKSNTVTGSKTYSNSLEVHVGGEFSGFGAKFKASLDYKTVHEQTSKFKKLYTTSFGECAVYTASVNNYFPPKLTKQFIKAVKTLPAIYEKGPYIKFLSIYGTHFMNTLDMGGRYSVVNKLSESGWTKLLDKEISVEIAASYSGFGMTGAAETRTKEQIKMAEEFNNVREEFALSIMGSRPPAKQGVVEWAREVTNEPMPLRYKLALISDLFMEGYIDDLKEKDLKRIRENMKLGYKDYCKELADKKVVDNCDAPSPDPAPPKLSNSCRLCRNNCGNGYTQHGGTFKALVLGFGNGCSGGINPFGDNAALCCKNPSEVRTDGCRYCQSCGREFPEKVGGVFLKSSIQSFDNQCSGFLRNRGNYGSLCCSKPASCKFCQTCGGDYHFETSVLQALPFFLLKIESFGQNCQGSLTMGPKSARLCCKHG